MTVLPLEIANWDHVAPFCLSSHRESFPDSSTKAFIPFTNAFHASPAGSTTMTTERPFLMNISCLSRATGRPGAPVAYEKGDRRRRESKVIQEKVKSASNIVVIGGGAYGRSPSISKTNIRRRRSQLIHSRPLVMNRFHHALHDIVMERFKAAGIETILGQRIKGIPDWFQNDEPSFQSPLLTEGKSLVQDLPFPLSDPLLSLSPSSVDPETKYVKVKPTLQIVDPKYPHVFSIGDVADTGAHKAARPAIAQAQIVLRNIQKLMKDEKAELETYKPDLPAIHLALGFRPSIKFKNPTSPDGEPMKILDDHGDLEAGCGKVWAMRAPGVVDYRL
ncbi:FAD/NAD-P-binding domain-containing protein [Desarmillaria tabescens]|uniref:FAD/NAD-P-binding domain-containing protein n=1 Tax=Armillaria tabescens TaxID=1929756 RepID=A0AA39JU95_ARMTA|nr:FAD/NAD-P-binding domain-containing protein [Desarmillaria tabescens]KAK0449035.1 FAD/NAD-P-binding domain-containing protein [Desarmillaria tabescens]